MKLKSIVVDDSSMQRMAVAKLINFNLNLELVAEYSNAVEAKKGIKNKEIDLIFLDVEMPIINGFDFLESLDSPPLVILIAGNPDYALKAFDYEVTDYLHKPITLARFDAAVKKVAAKYKQIHKIIEEEGHMFVKCNLHNRKVILKEIKWIEGLGDYLKLVTDEANIVILSTMNSFEEKLTEDKFLRIHRSYIVNLERVDKFNNRSVEVGGRQIPLSRNKKAELAEALINVKGFKSYI